MLIYGFLVSIVMSNLLVTYVDPVPVWPGVYAPAGVYVVALVLMLRDLVQRFHGWKGLLLAGVGGILVSYWLADEVIVTASILAFAASFVVDTLIFTLAYRWLALHWAVLVSGLIALVPDTLIFLHLAGLPQFIPGQLIGKTYGTLLWFAFTWWLSRRVLDHDTKRPRKAQASVPVPSE